MRVSQIEPIRQTLSEESALTLAATLLVAGFVAAFLVWRWTHVLFERTGLNNLIEGTAFERLAGRFGTSTAGIFGTLFALTVYSVTALLAFNIAQVVDIDVLWPRIAELLPQLLIAIIAIIAGLVLGDKAKLVVQDRLRSVKLPEVAVLPVLVKYSIFYIAALIALTQVGVATAALLVLLAAYAIGIVILVSVAFNNLLAAGAAGLYLVLNEPYSIGDEVHIDGKRGIVQEVNMFVTHIETDGEEHIIPNQRIFRSGIVRIRE